MSFQTPITIAEVIGGIESNDYILPAIQREFVWATGQIEALFDSLLRGYPIGAFLFWKVKAQNLGKFQFYRFMEKYHQRDHTHNEPIQLVGGQDVIAVLDGQQRLTALNIGLKGWYARKLPHYQWSNDHAFPKRRLYLNLKAPSDGLEFQYEFRMLHDKEVEASEGSKFWFPVGSVLTFNGVAEAFNYCVKNGLTEGGNTFPSDTLLELWQVFKAKPMINYFLETDQNLDKVLNIFIRVNSGGTPLSYSDMLLSIATAQWQEKDARQEIHELVDQLNEIGEGFAFTKDFVLKASLVLSDIQAIEFKVDNFNLDNMLHIEQEWDSISHALRLTVQLLASWGYNRQTLASNNAVIPMAYYLRQIESPASFLLGKQWQLDRERMHRWLAIALLKRTFSGQSDIVLRAIRGVLQKSHDAFPIEEIFDALRGTVKSMHVAREDLEGFLAYHYHQQYTFSVLALLYPWLKFDQHFHLDHIFPRSKFNRKELLNRGIPQDQWDLWLDHKDDLANLQLLQGLPNIQKSDMEFDAWIESTHSTPESLAHYKAHHLIPDVDLSFTNFPAFLAEREKLIMQRLATLLQGATKESTEPGDAFPGSPASGA